MGIETTLVASSSCRLGGRASPHLPGSMCSEIASSPRSFCSSSVNAFPRPNSTTDR